MSRSIQYLVAIFSKYLKNIKMATFIKIYVIFPQKINNIFTKYLLDIDECLVIILLNNLIYSMLAVGIGQRASSRDRSALSCMMMFFVCRWKVIIPAFLSVVVYSHVFPCMCHLPLTLMTLHSLFSSTCHKILMNFVAPGIVNALYATLPINHF